MLGDHHANQEIDSTLAKLGENPLLLGDLQRAVSPAKSVAADAPEKKERKKRQHDPNAPKRPLTPFFLYMQTARPIIQEDLGPDVAKGAVSNEGTRRWGTMEDPDKQVCVPAKSLFTHAKLYSSGPTPTKTTCASTTPECIHIVLATRMLRI